ncbi:MULTISPECIES: SDR family oxidoreductase [unclassified Rhizobium]|uniref:SDR family oxidoreductase n=1 Tax=unclassified Rhizobium TaxID=2613769 RepID=UPI0028A8C5B1|nr:MULTISPECIES: SDR family oxidoreductase [unclassified Rhizobium]
MLAAEFTDRKIRVNAVSPGPIETPIHRAPGQTEEEFRVYADKVGSKVPAGRMGKPEEIAVAVAFLASDNSSYMLGAEIAVDGGLGGALTMLLNDHLCVRTVVHVAAQIPLC